MRKIIIKTPPIIFALSFLLILECGFLAFLYIKDKKSSENIAAQEQKKTEAVLNDSIEALKRLESVALTDDNPRAIVEKIYLTVNPYSAFQFAPPKNYSQWWISEDGWNISDPGGIKISMEIPVIKMPADKINTYRSEFDYQPNSTHPLVGALNKAITSVFENSGFQLNVTNTSKTELDDSFYDYVVAFQKGETRCVLTTNADITSKTVEAEKEIYYFNYSINCLNQFQKAYQEQIFYLKALDARDRVVTIGERMGDFIWIGVNYRRTGSAILAKIQGENLRIIYNGQEYPSCDLMKKNQVPKEVYGECYD